MMHDIPSTETPLEGAMETFAPPLVDDFLLPDWLVRAVVTSVSWRQRCAEEDERSLFCLAFICVARMRPLHVSSHELAPTGQFARRRRRPGCLRSRIAFDTSRRSCMPAATLELVGLQVVTAGWAGPISQSSIGIATHLDGDDECGIDEIQPSIQLEAYLDRSQRVHDSVQITDQRPFAHPALSSAALKTRSLGHTHDAFAGAPPDNQ
jgi:hypothetical protein